MKKFLKIIAVGFIISAIFLNVYLCRENHIANTGLIRNQALILQLQSYFNEINVKRNILLEEKFNRDNDNMYVYLKALEGKFDMLNQENKGKLKENKDEIYKELNKIKGNKDELNNKLNKIKSSIPKEEVKPSFEYLKSVTIRIEQVNEKRVSIGTGTIIKVTEDFTYILTNKHMAPMNADNIYVVKNKKRYKADVLKNGVTRDLSLIRITGKIPNTSVVKGFAKTKEQDKIYSVGMYKSMYNIYTQGTVAGWTNNGSRLINMPVLNGCSGSGVFDKDGNMVAVLYAMTRYTIFGAMDTAKVWCIPYIGIMAFLEEIL